MNFVFNYIEIFIAVQVYLISLLKEKKLCCDKFLFYFRLRDSFLKRTNMFDFNLICAILIELRIGILTDWQAERLLDRYIYRLIYLLK